MKTAIRSRCILLEPLESRQLLTASIQISDGATVLSNGGTVDYGFIGFHAFAPKTLTVTNTGDQALTFGSMALSGYPPASGQNSPFVPIDVASNTPIIVDGSNAAVSSLAPGATAFIHIAPSAAVVQIDNATLVVNSNDSNPTNQAFTLNLTANIQMAQITASWNSITIVPSDNSTTPPTINTVVDFGTAVINDASPTATITIANTGNVPVTITHGIPLDSPNYRFDKSITNHTLNPGTSDTYIMAANTATPGVKPSFLNVGISNTDNANAIYLIALTTTVFAPEISVANGATSLDGTSTAVGFGTVGLTSTSQLTLTVTNSGTSVLHPGTVTMPTGFSVVTGLPGTIAVGASANLVIAADTGATGSLSGTMTIASDAFTLPMFSIPLTATVIGGRITVMQGSTAIANNGTIDFGRVAQSTSVTFSIAVSNTGLAPLTIASASVGAGFTVVTPLPSTIAVGASANLVVSPDTTDLRSLSATLTINTGDETLPSYTAILTANVVGRFDVTLNGAFLADAQSTPVDFGKTTVGSPVSKTFTVVNHGTTPLAINSVLVPTGFTLTSGGPTSIAAGASQDYVVRLDSAATGVYFGNIQIATDDPKIPVFHIPVSGKAQAGATIGVGGTPSLVFTDADGTIATVTLTGGGTVDLFFDGTNVTSATVKRATVVSGTSVLLDAISITGATAKTRLNIVTKKGNSLIDVATITSTAAMAGISARGVHLTGALTVPALTQLDLFKVDNATLTLTSGLGTATIRNDFKGTLAAASLKNLNVMGSINTGTITIAGEIGKIGAKGTITGSTISTTSGSIANLTAASLVNSNVYASVVPSSGNLPSAAGDFKDTGNAQIKLLNVKSFVNSDIAARKITNVNLGAVTFANGGNPQGIAGRFYSSLTFKGSTGKLVHITKVFTTGQLQTELVKSGTVLIDFHILVI